jgi:hypothetical protein
MPPAHSINGDDDEIPAFNIDFKANANAADFIFQSSNVTTLKNKN